MQTITESTVEDAARAWLEAIVWHVAHGPEIAPDMPASDGIEPRAGTLTAGREWFKCWRTMSAEAVTAAHMPEFQVEESRQQ